MDYIANVENLAGNEFRVGAIVQHCAQGWDGVVVAIRERGGFIDLMVMPLDIEDERQKRDSYRLNPIAAERAGHVTFCRALDHGLSMGNYEVLKAQDIGACVRAYDLLAEGEHARPELADALLEQMPGLFNYDERGNWVGNVSNENGWTA